jgi:DNA excision repair protein ERCC-2
MLPKDKLNSLLFPHDTVREIQSDLITEVEKAIWKKQSIIMHAPTGLGKTASTLPIALSYALKHDLKVFFLTSRHTQHKIAIETLKQIKQKHKVDFTVADIIGKRWMCLQPNATKMYSSEFSEFCKALVEDDQCEYYLNTRNKSYSMTPKAQQAQADLKRISPATTEQITNISRAASLCPYEISLEQAKKARVIIADYNYIFNPVVQQNFFNKTSTKMESSIIIVDEAHNLPNRIRDSLTHKLSSFMLKRAISEAKKYNYLETLQTLERLQKIVDSLASEFEFADKTEEKLITKQQLVDEIEEIKDYAELLTDLEFIAADILMQQKRSFVASVHRFLDEWTNEDTGFARILTKQIIKNELNVTISFRCLDPGIITGPVFQDAHSSILMSGTLNPTSMYTDILDLPEERVEKTYPNPFPKINRLSLIVPETTTKFTQRSPEQFKRIAEICTEIINTVPGNTAVFFPSYYIRNEVYNYLMTTTKKTVLLEVPNLTKQEKNELLEKFKSYSGTGSALLAVSSGSFGEGIDLPGDLLKCVIVVGLPLSRPDLETKELMRYYDEKFKRGWDYGYIFPAFNKCIQTAGRCIRSESDRGTIIFLDERFTWGNYYKCFPRDWNVEISQDYIARIEKFFEKTR